MMIPKIIKPKEKKICYNSLLWSIAKRDSAKHFNSQYFASMIGEWSNRWIERVNITMYAKLLCGAKMQTPDHGVTVPLIPPSAHSPGEWAEQGTKMEWISSESPCITLLMPEGPPGVRGNSPLMLLGTTKKTNIIAGDVMQNKLKTFPIKMDIFTLNEWNFQHGGSHKQEKEVGSQTKSLKKKKRIVVRRKSQVKLFYFRHSLLRDARRVTSRRNV